MPGVVPSRLPAAAAALPVAGVRNGDHGNGDGPSDNGSSDSDDEVKTVDISPKTDWSPPSNLPNVFKEPVGFSSTDAWADNKRFGPTITALLKRWSAPPSGFRPQRDFH